MPCARTRWELTGPPGNAGREAHRGVKIKFRDLNIITGRVTIGGYTITFDTDEFPVPFQLDPRYESFRGRGKGDITLTIKCEEYNISHGKHIFQTDYPWDVRMSDTGPLYRFFESKTLRKPYMTACFNSLYTNGTIYVKPLKPGTPVLPNPFGYPIDELLMINFLSRGRGMIFHSLGISCPGKGLLFAGPSGAGKSTLAGLLQNGKKGTVLSDDRIIMRKIKNRFVMFGTPWHGEAGISSPDSSEVDKIFFICHAKKNRRKRLTLMDAASRLLVCSFPTFWDKRGMEFAIGFINELVERIPCYELGVVPDKGIVDFIT